MDLYEKLSKQLEEALGGIEPPDIFTRIFQLGGEIASLEQKKKLLFEELGKAVYENQTERQAELINEIKQIECKIKIINTEMEGLENEIK
jgi:seryl-tRNA synthetase